MLEKLYRAFPATFVARRNLTRNRVRSILTVLGIAIGVVAVASLGIFGNTLQADMTGSLSDIGSTVVVSPAYDEGVRSLSERDVRTIERAAEEATVVPLKRNYQFVSAGESQTVTETYGLEEPGRILDAREGRIPSNFRDGVLVGPQIADKMEVGVGDTVDVEGTEYRVRAVLESKRTSVLSSDEAVFLPESGFESDGYSMVMVDAETANAANATAQSIRSEVNGRTKRASVTELADQVDRIESVFEALNVFLTGVAAISLFVAGVGILNVMLMSAVERRQEVGVLRAVGLRRFDVLKIMLIEATLLGVVGSLIGGTISAGSGMVVNAFLLGDPMRAFAPGNVSYLLFAVGFGVLIGVLSGVYPAWKASRERPVEALRH